jgi:hypothetical protein
MRASRSVPPLLLLAGFLLAWAWVAAPAGAAEGPVTVTATPNQVTLSPGGSADGLLMLVNGGPTPVAVAVRPVTADKSVKVTMPVTSATVAASGSTSLDFTVTRVAEGAGQEVVASFVVTYPQASAVATVTIKAVASPAIIEAKVESAVDRIDENRPGAAALVLSNPRETAVRVTSLAVTAPVSTTVTVTCPGGVTVSASSRSTVDEPGCSFLLAGRQQQILPVTLTAADSVVPGSRSATFRVQASDGGKTVGVLATTAFAVDVFGESDILKAVGVPAFLVLPGVIILVAAWFLISRLSPWQPVAATGGVVETVTKTAILGVALSLVVAKIYPWLTGYKRDYLRAYGFLDFYYVFVYSFAIAVAFWVIALIAYQVRRGFRALFVPQPGDPPAALLRKIGMRGIFGGGTKFSRVQLDGKGGVILCDRPGGAVLVAPRIIASANGSVSKATIEDLAAGDQAVRLWRKARGAGLNYNADDVAAVIVTEKPAESSGQLVAIVQVAT